ncbi:hypothetical protein [Cetobacterium sp.]|uniref:hypothetical protein n=1 Tax=Cetobacterium sp. TaxID=2071632 RepID=UPI0025BF9F12|nr:hypothetical protein [Cetobacterium sp.]
MKKICIIISFYLIMFQITTSNINQSSTEIKITGKVVANASLIVKVDGVETNEILLENYIKGSNNEISKLISFELKEEYSKKNITLKDVTYSGNEKGLYKIQKFSGEDEKNFKISYNNDILNKLDHGTEIEDVIVFTATYD